MATLRFEPIASQLAKDLSPALLFPREALERIAQQQLEGLDAWTPELRDFMGHYTELVRAAHSLLDAPQFERLAWLSEELDDEYSPGGPPLSPIYDSYSVQHVLAEVPQGLARETPYSVLARLLSGDTARTRLCDLARCLADSHLDLYQVLRASELESELQPVRGGPAFSAQLTGPFLRTGDLILARVLAFGDSRVIADSPYLLEATQRDWLDYLDRVQRRSQLQQATPESSSPGSSRAKLSSKQAARRRKQQKLTAARRTPDEVVAAHLKYGADERFWPEFIMDGYAGERNGIVRLAGVPDRAESLPHGQHFTGVEEEDEVPAMHRVRLRVTAIAREQGILEREKRALAEAARKLGVDQLQLHAGDEFLLRAYCTLGARSDHGATALELVGQEHDLAPDERMAIASIQGGRFAVLHVRHIQLDEGIDAVDVLRSRKVHIRERSATRQLGLGDLVLGWICDEGTGDCTLEGGVLHVPALVAQWVSDTALRLWNERRAEVPREAPEQRAIEIVIPLLAHIQWLRKNPPLPALYNTHGEPLQLATARYAVLDLGRARTGLQKIFHPRDEDRFTWLDHGDVSLAEIELSNSNLTVRVNSLERLGAAKERIEAELGDAVRATLGTLDGDSDALHARAREAGAIEPPLDLASQPAEVVEQLHGMLLEQIKRNFDTPIPAFKGRSLRQVARSKFSADAVSWLREQERILKTNPQLKALDMRPLWQDLGLEYRGLQSDP
ncbi:MAG TPA: hypothetical protein VFS67_11120 [Polyangiaceae bacterium]|nr:hypothetical protein [Polyangiaceae bacterium]